MATGTAFRQLLVALGVTLMYWFLLNVSHELIRGAYLWSTSSGRPFPHGPVQVVAWFALVNAAGALLAALPVGLALARWGWGLSRGWVVVVGAVAAAIVVGREVLDFAWYTEMAKLIVGLTQFIEIAIAPLLVVTLAMGRPLTTRSSGR